MFAFDMRVNDNDFVKFYGSSLISGNLQWRKASISFTSVFTLNVAQHRGRFAGRITCRCMCLCMRCHHLSSSLVISDSCYKPFSPCLCHGLFGVTHCFSAVLFGLAVHLPFNMNEVSRAEQAVQLDSAHFLCAGTQLRHTQIKLGLVSICHMFIFFKMLTFFFLYFPKTVNFDLMKVRFMYFQRNASSLIGDPPYDFYFLTSFDQIYCI